MIETLHGDGSVSLTGDARTWALYGPAAEQAAAALTADVEAILNQHGPTDAAFASCLATLTAYRAVGATDTVVRDRLRGLFAAIREAQATAPVLAAC